MLLMVCCTKFQVNISNQYIPKQKPKQNIENTKKQEINQIIDEKSNSNYEISKNLYNFNFLHYIFFIIRDNIDIIKTHIVEIIKNFLLSKIIITVIFFSIVCISALIINFNFIFLGFFLLFFITTIILLYTFGIFDKNKFNNDKIKIKALENKKIKQSSEKYINNIISHIDPKYQLMFKENNKIAMRKLMEDLIKITDNNVKSLVKDLIPKLILFFVVFLFLLTLFSFKFIFHEYIRYIRGILNKTTIGPLDFLNSDDVGLIKFMSTIGFFGYVYIFIKIVNIIILINFILFFVKFSIIISNFFFIKLVISIPGLIANISIYDNFVFIMREFSVLKSTKIIDSFFDNFKQEGYIIDSTKNKQEYIFILCLFFMIIIFVLMIIIFLKISDFNNSSLDIFFVKLDITQIFDDIISIINKLKDSNLYDNSFVQVIRIFSIYNKKFIEIENFLKNNKIILLLLIIFILLMSFINSIVEAKKTALTIIKIQSIVLDASPKEEIDTIRSIKFNNASISHDGKVTVLKNLNFTLNSGVVFIYGPSGAGKSTLLNAILLHKFSSGITFYDGARYLNAKDINGNSLINRVSFMAQNGQFFGFNNFTLYEMLYNQNQSITIPEILNMLDNLGFSHWAVDNDIMLTKLGVNGSNLSGGTRDMFLFLGYLLNNSIIKCFDEFGEKLDKKSFEKSVITLIKLVIPDELLKEQDYQTNNDDTNLSVEIENTNNKVKTNSMVFFITHRIEQCLEILEQFAKNHNIDMKELAKFIQFLHIGDGTATKLDLLQYYQNHKDSNFINDQEVL